MIAYSCLAQLATDADIKSVVGMLVQSVKRREDAAVIGAVTMALVRLQTIAAQNAPTHRLMFWLCIVLFQLEHLPLYARAVDLLETNLQMLDRLGMFEHSVSN